jgi:release factor glutamine methyltransferase
LLVETALAVLPKDAPARVLDLGVGSGAIVLAILAERPHAKAVAVDFSEAALAVAQRNADKLGLASRLELRSGDWSAGLEETFNLVVSNPPYIPTGEIADLEPEVSKYEPRLALDGGADGLAAYRSIIAALPTLLVPGGVFALEVGRGQDFAVAALAAEAGLSPEQSKMDLNGIARVVWGRRSS